MASSKVSEASSGVGVARQRSASKKMKLKFTNSSAALLEDHTHNHTPSSTTRRYMASRASAALQLHRARIHSLTQRLALWFLLCLALLLAWTIGYFNASPALLVLLGIASVAIGAGRWQQVVEGARLEAELRARQKLRSHVVGESVEWLNVALNKWWNKCDDTILYFLKDHVESLVKDILPGAIDKIEVVGVDLGGQTPSLSNVRLQDAPSTVGVASEGATTTSMVATFDVTIPAPDARITLRATVGGKTLSSSHLAYIESLYVSGTLQAMLVFDNQLPFPHISKITGTFVSRPDVWFSVRVLRGVRVMEIPLLRNWVHSLVMDVFTTLLVDPGKLTFNLDQSKKEHATAGQGRIAKGVVVVTVSGRPPARATKKDVSPGRYVTLRLGNKKYESSLEAGTWQAKYAFLVYDLEQEVLVLKVKQRKLLYATTLSVHSTSLASLGLMAQPGESPDDRVVNYGGSECQFSLHLSYSGLSQISLQAPTTQPKLLPHQNAGVLYVHVHDGVHLKAADSNGLSDPYCVVMANKQQIMKTDHVAGTLHPTWDTAVEVLLADMEQVVLMFAVFDYDGPMVGDDFLGVAKLPLSLNNSCILQQSLPLRELGCDTSDTDSSLGSITVSVVLRPVASVGEACPSCLVGGQLAHMQEEAMLELGNTARRKSVNLSSVRKKNKKRERRREATLRESDEEGYDVEPVMEVQVLKGRDLVPKDSNGLSDPYVVIKYGSQVMFRSSVIKKTLNPHWAESATLTAPGTDDVIYVECWDKDIFSDDYMGSMTFTQSDVTSLFTGKPRWCKLQHVKHGELLLHMSLHRERGRSLDDERSDEVRWSHLDEASRQLVGEVELREDERVGGVVKMRSGSGTKEEESGSSVSSSSSHSGHHRDSSSEAALSFTSSSIGVGNGSATTFSPGRVSVSSAELIKPTSIKRRHTLGHHGVSKPSEIYKKYEDTTDPSHLPRYPETTADINWALAQNSTDGGVAGGRSSATSDRASYKEKVLTVYHNISGQVIEATGLKGNLDHMELYVKVRLNTRPSYQRQHKFARGPVVHKTRNLRGSHNPQWMEDFVVKESPVASDSLLTLDLKSGSKVNIGTYVITLDKFLEGQMKSTRTLDIGNDMKLKVKVSRQLPIVQ